MARARISIQTFGCRVNQYDSNMMRDRLAPVYDITDEDPDVILLNACTVTDLAERKARQAARRMRRQYPAVCIVVIGCLADAVNQGTTQFSDADLLAGNSWKSQIDYVVQQALSGACGRLASTSFGELSAERSYGPQGRIRAFLKIQDGCGRTCTYCRATQVRGTPRSKSIEDSIAEARELLAAGFPEIVLTGIDLAQYSPSGGCLADVLEAIASLSGLRRLRIASINPSGITPELIETFATHEIVSPHFHIPLQSGDDGILAAMDRGFDSQGYLDAIERIRSRIPHATFGSDIIVGFPGEDETAFANTCHIVEAVGFVNLHAFRFSPRRGTAAAEFPDQIPADVKRRRSEWLLAHWEQGLGRTLDNRIGSSQDILVEEHREDCWRGYTHDYLYVKFPSDQEIPVGSIVSVRIIGRTGSTLKGVNDHRIGAS
ncbi:MAG: tRNA (N(6)-L-threonylcarbamoyladenosine(37)-C(2))-methylthiotransferase MtaB [Candidatus Bipolaricaulota bacterium]